MDEFIGGLLNLATRKAQGLGIRQKFNGLKRTLVGLGAFRAHRVSGLESLKGVGGRGLGAELEWGLGFERVWFRVWNRFRYFWQSCRSPNKRPGRA